MTPLEMQIAFELEISKIDSLDKPLTVDIEYWLNTAQLMWIKSRYTGVNLVKEGFEQSQKRIDDLAPLLKSENINPTPEVNFKGNTYWALLPPDYMFTVSEDVTIIYTDVITNQNVTKQMGVTETTQDRYRFMIDNPMSPHKFHYQEARPLRLILGDYAQLITDGNYGIQTYHVTYIREPQEISIFNDDSCELFDQTHPEIVALAVNLYLENIGDRRFQTQTAQLQKAAQI